jgi:hypothetical protein
MFLFSSCTKLKLVLCYLIKVLFYLLLASAFEDQCTEVKNCISEIGFIETTSFAFSFSLFDFAFKWIVSVYCKNRQPEWLEMLYQNKFKGFVLVISNLLLIDYCTISNNSMPLKFKMLQMHLGSITFHDDLGAHVKYPILVGPYRPQIWLARHPNPHHGPQHPPWPILIISLLRLYRMTWLLLHRQWSRDSNRGVLFP